VVQHRHGHLRAREVRGEAVCMFQDWEAQRTALSWHRERCEKNCSEHAESKWQASQIFGTRKSRGRRAIRPPHQDFTASDPEKICFRTDCLNFITDSLPGSNFLWKRVKRARQHKHKHRATRSCRGPCIPDTQQSTHPEMVQAVAPSMPPRIARRCTPSRAAPFPSFPSVPSIRRPWSTVARAH
jgi:hypothetical protein